MTAEAKDSLLARLQPLCDENNSKAALPGYIEWKDKLWIVATNGQGLVAVQADIECQPHACASSITGMLNDLLEEFSAIDLNRLKAWAGEPQFEKECEGCDGEGIFYRRGYTYECLECYEGKTPRPSDPYQIKHGARTVQCNRILLANYLSVVAGSAAVAFVDIQKTRTERRRAYIAIRNPYWIVVVCLMNAKPEETAKLPVFEIV